MVNHSPRRDGSRAETEQHLFTCRKSISINNHNHNITFHARDIDGEMQFDGQEFVDECFKQPLSDAHVWIRNE